MIEFYQKNTVKNLDENIMNIKNASMIFSLAVGYAHKKYISSLSFILEELNIAMDC